MAIKILYETIKEERNKLELSQQELSNQTGVNINIIKALETGRSNTTKDNISKIAERLGLNINDIYIEDFRETKIIAAANNKGGSGKTTVASNLGYSLSQMGYKILFIDGDMQMNLSYSFGKEKNDDKNLNHAILYDAENIEDYILETDYENIDIIISDFDMARIEQIIFTKTFRESILKVKLEPLIKKGVYDFIIFDTNPTLGLLNFNILNASDYILVPVEMTAFGILGLEILTRFIGDVKKINKNLKLLGVLKNKVDIRENITKKADEVLIDVFGDKIMKTTINIDTNVKKAQWDRSPLTVETRAKDQYDDLAREVISLVK
ncbi:AAA family ATPase [Tissierella carlieri]|uniref:AAA family ATPase n=1 Tax=Tissierella carlieri TaxID=689904 RepID=A0ABT1SEZ0_9FIRM|nr:AAA family ATPase [Tissierella carlieri]MCQ4925062.1 AAA family ATPase [Tissierella carlieri]